MAIGRSSTGMYHRVVGDASECNGRSFRGYKVGLDMVERAPEHMFCKKCFSVNRRDPSRKANAIFVHALDVERDEKRKAAQNA